MVVRHARSLKKKLSPTENEKMMQEKHTEKKNAAYIVKAGKDKISVDPSTLAFSFDLEATLYTSCSKVSTLFYKGTLHLQADNV